jgi:hypothetical protein
MIGVFTLLLLSATNAARIDTVDGNVTNPLAGSSYFLQAFRNEKVV